MPTPFVSICPHCQTKLKLKNPALIGKKAKCPSCQEAFVVKRAGGGDSKPKSRPVSKPKPKPQPDDELDPWLSDDLGDYESEDDWPPKSSAAGDAPPPVQGVRKKQKKSSSAGGRKSSRQSSGGVFAGNPWIGWVLGGGIAGVLGAALWGGIVAFTFEEWGILAWALGGFVGFGVRVGAREDDAGIAPAVTAVGIALASVVLGKFLAVHFLTARLENIAADLGVDAEQVEQSEEETIESIIADYAYDIELDWEDQGRELHNQDWETLPDDAPTSAYYDPDAWAEAEQKWNEMSDEEKAAEILAYETGEFDLEVMEGAMFMAMFGLFDILWFFLAGVTAFKVGSGLDFGDDD